MLAVVEESERNIISRSNMSIATIYLKCQNEDSNGMLLINKD